MAAYRKQGRGGKGVTGAETKDTDYIEALHIASTHDYLLVFTGTARVHWLRVYDIPQGSRTSKGRAVVNLLDLREGSKVASVIPVDRFDDQRMLVMATRRGLVKKTMLREYGRPRAGGIIGMALEEGDSLVGVVLTRPDQELLLATADGCALRFPSEKVRAMGRDTHGVRGIQIRGEGNAVVALIALEEGMTILTSCALGYGKRSGISEYPRTNRGGLGVINIKTSERNGPVVSVNAVREDDDLMLITEKGMVIRTPATALRIIGRATQGVRLISLQEGDRLVDVTPVARDVNGGDGPAEAAPGQGVQAAPEAPPPEPGPPGPELDA